MMLIKDFYKVLVIKFEDQTLKATLMLNPDHPVYRGHFPGQPVVPGVMQLQMIKEILEQHKHQKLRVNNISQVKFLNMVIPDNQPIQLHINFLATEDEQLKVDGYLSIDERIATKIKATYTMAG